MKTAKAFRSVENLPVPSVEPAISGSRALSPDNSTRRPGKQPGQQSPSQLHQETHSSCPTLVVKSGRPQTEERRTFVCALSLLTS